MELMIFYLMIQINKLKHQGDIFAHADILLKNMFK